MTIVWTQKKDSFLELKSESMNHLQGQLGPLGLPLHDAFSQKNPHQQTNTWVNEVAVGLFAAQPKNHFYHLCHSIPMPCTNSFKGTILHGGVRNLFLSLAFDSDVVIKKFGRGIAGYQVSGSDTLNWNMQFRKLSLGL